MFVQKAPVQEKTMRIYGKDDKKDLRIFEVASDTDLSNQNEMKKFIRENAKVTIHGPILAVPAGENFEVPEVGLHWYNLKFKGINEDKETVEIEKLAGFVNENFFNAPIGELADSLDMKHPVCHGSQYLGFMTQAEMEKSLQNNE